MINLYMHVQEAYTNALENGYDEIEDWSAEELATDMCTYDSVLEAHPIELVAEAIREYRKNSRA